jgi:hypothetical protein
MNNLNLLFLENVIPMCSSRGGSLGYLLFMGIKCLLEDMWYDMERCTGIISFLGGSLIIRSWNNDCFSSKFRGGRGDDILD